MRTPPKALRSSTHFVRTALLLVVALFFGFDTPPQALIRLQSLEKSLILAEKMVRAGSSNGSSRNKIALPLTESTIQTLVQQATIARDEIARFAQQTWDASSYTQRVSAGEEAFIPKEERSANDWTWLSSAWKPPSQNTTRLEAVSQYASRYLSALARLYVQYARYAHSASTDLGSRDFGALDTLRLFLPKTIVEQMPKELLITLSMNLRHAPSRSDQVEVFLNAFDTEICEYIALNDVQNAVDYGKLVQFSATRAAIANRFSLNKIDANPSASKEIKIGLPFLSFRTVHPGSTRVEDILSYAHGHAKYEDAIRFVSPDEVSRLQASLKGIALTDFDTYQSLFYEALKANQDFIRTMNEKSIDVITGQEAQDVFASARLVYEQEQKEWDSRVANEIVSSVFYLGDAIDPAAIAQRAAEQAYAIRAINLTFGSFQKSNDRYGVRDSAPMTKAIGNHLAVQKDSFTKTVRAKVQAWVESYLSPKARQARALARRQERLRFLSEIMSPAIPAAAVQLEIESLLSAEARKRALTESVRGRAQASNAFSVQARALEIQEEIRSSYLASIPNTFDRFAVKINTPTTLLALFLMRKNEHLNVRTQVSDVSETALKPFFDRLNLEYAKRIQQLQNERKPEFMSEKEFHSLASTVAASFAPRLTPARVIRLATPEEWQAHQAREKAKKAENPQKNKFPEVLRVATAEEWEKENPTDPNKRNGIDLLDLDLSHIRLSRKPNAQRVPFLANLKEVAEFAEFIIARSKAYSAFLRDGINRRSTLFERAVLKAYYPLSRQVDSEQLKALIEDELTATRAADEGVAETFLAADARIASKSPEFKKLFRGVKHLRDTFVRTTPSWSEHESDMVKETETPMEKFNRIAMNGLMLALAIFGLVLVVLWVAGIVAAAIGTGAVAAVTKWTGFFMALSQVVLVSGGTVTGAALMFTRAYVLHYELPIDIAFAESLAQAQARDNLQNGSSSVLKEILSSKVGRSAGSRAGSTASSAAGATAGSTIDAPLSTATAVAQQRETLKNEQINNIPFTVLDIVFTRMGVRQMLGTEFVQSARQLFRRPRAATSVFDKNFLKQAPSLIRTNAAPKKLEQLTYAGLPTLTHDAVRTQLGERTAELLTEQRISTLANRVSGYVDRLSKRLNANGELQGFLTLKEFLNPEGTHARYSYPSIYLNKLIRAVGWKNVQPLVDDGIDVFGAYAPRTLIAAIRQGQLETWFARYGKKFALIAKYRAKVIEAKLADARRILQRIELLQRYPGAQYAVVMRNSAKKLGLSEEAIAYLRTHSAQPAPQILMGTLSESELTLFEEMLQNSIFAGAYWQDRWLLSHAQSLGEFSLTVKDANLLMSRLRPSHPLIKSLANYSADEYTRLLEAQTDEIALDPHTVQTDLRNFRNTVYAIDDLGSTRPDIQWLRKMTEKEFGKISGQ